VSRSALGHELDDLLRRCVQCGLCLPHCATWLATGNEVQSPRGRLVLLDGVLRDAAAGGGAPDRSFLAAFDLCIGCRACEAACPSGVPYSLLERGHELAAGARPAAAVPGFVLRQLDDPGVLGALESLARIATRGARLLLGPRWRRLLDGTTFGRLLGTMPRAPRRDRELVALLDGRSGLTGPWRPPRAADRRDTPLAFFRGCANRGLLPDASRRLGSLCAAAGFALTDPPGQDCCGALAAHTDRPGRAARLRGRNREAFAAGDGPVPILVEAAGCALEMTGYGPDWAARVTTPATLLADADLPALAVVPLRVAVHDPCHARHGLGVVEAPRRLLRRIPGVEILEPEEAEVCCGSGGAWGLRHPDLAEELGRRKARLLAATGADLVVTTNPGCLGQIADGLALTAPELPILPLTDLVWYAAARAGAGGGA
jgi:glycolate oxidase iron-sulfur subunit